MTKQRLDIALTQRKLATSRSQSENWIKLGKVIVDGQVIMKPGHFVGPNANIKLTAEIQYVSRAGLKLESVADILKLDFRDKTVLDVGSSTGGFTDYALRHGAKKVYAVDVGTNQMHPTLRHNRQIELHEKTDIRDFYILDSRKTSPDPGSTSANSGDILSGGGDTVVSSTAEKWRLDGDSESGAVGILRKSSINEMPNIIVIDVSFISLRDILPHIYNYLSNNMTQIVAMVKPQFEAGKDQTNKGIIKNDAMRRQILRDFEDWSRNYFVIINKRDSDVAGAKGNQERFYLLKPILKSVRCPANLNSAPAILP